MTIEIEQAATAVLVVHQRQDISGCLCGWAEIGRSHAQHQAKMLAGAGLLADRNGGQRA